MSNAGQLANGMGAPKGGGFGKVVDYPLATNCMPRLS